MASPSSVVSIRDVLAALVLLGGGGLWWWRARSKGGGADTPGSPSTAEAGGSSPPPEELLSNEERVVALLEAHGGRMKQQAIVEELGWTDAKTSQVVGKLREAGAIEGFRLGRENVLRLPEVDEFPAPGELARDGPDDQAE